MFLHESQLFQLSESLARQPFQARPAALAGLQCRLKEDTTKYLNSYTKKVRCWCGKE